MLCGLAHKTDGSFGKQTAELGPDLQDAYTRSSSHNSYKKKNMLGWISYRFVTNCPVVASGCHDIARIQVLQIPLAQLLHETCLGGKMPTTKASRGETPVRQLGKHVSGPSRSDLVRDMTPATMYENSRRHHPSMSATNKPTKQHHKVNWRLPMYDKQKTRTPARQ